MNNRDTRQSHILVVDDEETGREVLDGILRADGYAVRTAVCGDDAIALTLEDAPDLILLDVMMPGMDGFKVCERIRAVPQVREIPIILVTALDDRASRLRGMEVGADDFVTKPYDRLELRARVKAVTRLNRYRTLLEERVRLVEAYERTLEGWVRALDLRDRETEGHTQRVTVMTVRLAKRMGLPADECEHIRRGALLHDIGKIGVPDSILHKPGALTADEWIQMKQHPEHAKALLEPIRYLRPAIDVAYCHHEKWDGTGYPQGLKGIDIPIAARMFAVVDTFDALTSERPYKRAWTLDEALALIESEAGKHFDPAVVPHFAEMARNGAFNDTMNALNLADAVHIA